MKFRIVIFKLVFLQIVHHIHRELQMAHTRLETVKPHLRQSFKKRLENLAQQSFVPDLHIIKLCLFARMANVLDSAV